MPIESLSLSRYRTVAQPGPRNGTSGIEKSRQHLHDADEHEQNLLIGFGSFSFIGLSADGFETISLLSTGFTTSLVWSGSDCSTCSTTGTDSWESTKSWTTCTSWLTIGSWRTEFAAGVGDDVTLAYNLAVVVSISGWPRPELIEKLLQFITFSHIFHFSVINQSFEIKYHIGVRHFSMKQTRRARISPDIPEQMVSSWCLLFMLEIEYKVWKWVNWYSWIRFSQDLKQLTQKSLLKFFFLNVTFFSYSIRKRTKLTVELFNEC